MFIRSLTLALMAATTITAHAAAVVPDYDTFKPFAAATYGGGGSRTDPSAVKSFLQTDGNKITLALTAHKRLCNEPLTNNGIGTFTAQPGRNAGKCSTPSPDQGATWNFGYYLDLGTTTFRHFGPLDVVSLFYDLDPGKNTDFLEYGQINFKESPNPDLHVLQDSQNLDFDVYNNGDRPYITEPKNFAFDPSIPGEYGFVLRVTTEGFTHDLSILVDVGAAATNVPEPGTLALVGLALAGMGALRRRKA